MMMSFSLMNVISKITSFPFFSLTVLYLLNLKRKKVLAFPPTPIF